MANCVWIESILYLYAKRTNLIEMTSMEIVNVREKTETKIVFASTDDLTKFFDLITNGQGVIFKYVESKDPGCSEYINPQIFTQINDGKIKITSKGGK